MFALVHSYNAGADGTYMSSADRYPIFSGTPGRSRKHDLQYFGQQHDLVLRCRIVQSLSFAYVRDVRLNKVNVRLQPRSEGGRQVSLQA